MRTSKTIHLLLFSRLLLFAFFQALFAIAFQSWAESEKYWIATATLTNIVSIIILIRQFKNEGLNYFSLYRFSKTGWKNDIFIFTGITLLSIPLVLAPSFLLSNWLWGNTTYYHQVLFQPINSYLVYVLLIAFPITIGLAELGTYFGFIMLRLKKSIHPKWIAVLLPVIFLSIQHCTLPLVFDTKFILLRGLMYLPFALMIGIALYKRPSLLPYLAILHGLLDCLTVIMVLQEIK